MDWKTKTIKVEDLKENVDNPRKISDKDYKKLCK